jgi:putative tryptophan/tyrosine transport system substrate-binding protein
MKKQLLALSFGAMLFALCVPANAQQTGKVPRIGYLTASPHPVCRPASRPSGKGCESMATLRGKTLSLTGDLQREKLDRLPALAAELVRLKVDVIVTSAPPATRPTKEATSTIPVVMAQDSDPVGSGFVASLARPGGNITGLATLSPEISGKQLELLKEIVPKLTRVAVLGTSTRAGTTVVPHQGRNAAGGGHFTAVCECVLTLRVGPVDSRLAKAPGQR